MKRYLRLLIPKALGIIFLKNCLKRKCLGKFNYKKKIVKLVVCYKFVMIIMQFAKFTSKVFVEIKFSQAFFSSSNHWSMECFRKIIPRAFRMNNLKYLFRFPNELELHQKKYQIPKNILKPSTEAVYPSSKSKTGKLKVRVPHLSIYWHTQQVTRHCKHLQRSQSHSVELIFSPWLEKISGLTLVPNRR